MFVRELDAAGRIVETPVVSRVVADVHAVHAEAERLVEVRLDVAVGDACHVFGRLAALGRDGEVVAAVREPEMDLPVGVGVDAVGAVDRAGRRVQEGDLDGCVLREAADVDAPDERGAVGGFGPDDAEAGVEDGAAGDRHRGLGVAALLPDADVGDGGRGGRGRGCVGPGPDGAAGDADRAFSAIAAADRGGAPLGRGIDDAAGNVDGCHGTSGAAADAGRVAAAVGRDAAPGNRDDAAVAVPAAADAGPSFSVRGSPVRGRPDVAARNGDAAAIGMLIARRPLSAADAGAPPAAGRDHGAVLNRDGAAVAVPSAADAGRPRAAGGGHAAAGDRDVPAIAARGVLAGGAADARPFVAALRDHRAAEDADGSAVAGAVAAAVVPGRAAADARGIPAAGGRHMAAVNCDVAAVAAVAAVHSVYSAAAADARAGRAALRNHRGVADEHSAASGPVATADARAALAASRVDCAAEDRDRAARAAGAAADAGGPGAACRAQCAVAGNRERVARGHPDARIALAGGDRGFPVERHRHGVVAVEEERAGSYVRIHAEDQVPEFDFARRLHPHVHLAFDVRAGERVVRSVREVKVQAIPILPALALESRDIDAVHGHARSPDGRVDIGARNDGAVGFAAFADVHDETVVAIRKPDVDLAAIVGIEVVAAVGIDICVVEPI